MRVPLLLFILCFSALQVFGQQKPDAQRDLPMRLRYKPVGYANTLTLNLPTLVVIDHLPGFAVGLEYERFLNQEGRLSISVPAYAFIARTPNKGPNQVEVKGYYAATALYYHPLGNKRFVDYSFGPVVAIGSLEKTEYRDIDRLVGYYSNNFLALQLQGNMTVHTTGRFVFALHASVGSLIANKILRDLLCQAGMKMGVRF